MPESTPGRYIVIKGIDGAGKTTQKDLLVDRYRELGRNVVDLIEPGGTPIGQALRKIILDPDLEKQPATELDLFTVARRELVYQVIDPAITKGLDVVSDRNWFSSVAYQGFGRGLALPYIIEKSRNAMVGYFLPDKVAILDMPLEITEERLNSGRAKADWFEKQGREFFTRVREGYHWLAGQFNIELVDGSLALFSVNSFLYGFYISPILGAQKARIDALHQIVRGEATALFDLVLDLKKLPAQTRNQLQAMVTAYIKSKMKRNDINGGENEYEELITYCVDYKGDDKTEIEGVLSDLVKNQQNRTNFSMQMGNKIFTNEWHIISILFFITLGFILTISIPHNYVMRIVKALLCTGLTMLIVNLVKLNSLTHKKAKQMWSPLQKLTETNFYRID